MAKKDTSQKAASEKTSAGGPNGAAAMPLFYTKPEPLDRQKHASLGLKKGLGLSFTKGVNAVPINLVEFPQICHHYPIAFSPDNNATPVAILGVRDGENLFATEDGGWEDAYIPAYIRRYPFIFSELPDSDQLTLCIDMNEDIIGENTDQPLFDKNGEPTELANSGLEFCKSYHAFAQKTIDFSRALAESDLLVERKAEIRAIGNREIYFSGFRIVDEKKLSELDDKTFLKWRENNWLPFLYAHLFSGAQWNRLTLLLNRRLEKEAA